MRGELAVRGGEARNEPARPGRKMVGTTLKSFTHLEN